jgi:uncharacterized lipoprotein YajG
MAIAMLSGCNPAVLKYQLDPEINNLDRLSQSAKIVALKITDNRVTDPADNSNQKIISGPKDETKLLQDKLIALLKQNGYKIISKPLLADVAFELEITTLKLTIESSTFKSVIRGNSEIKLITNKHSQQWSKIYRATREQEVANPANDLDATGVINQMLTKQLSSIFSDPDLKDFISK